MPLLIRDIETRSTVDLTDVGPFLYATHPKTEVLCLGYCVDEGPIQLWHPGDPVPRAYKDAASDKPWSWHVVAHNASFEMMIERHILGPRFKFPVPPLTRNVCTMAIANSLALPASLDKLVKAINLEHKKDVVGARVMKQLAKPRRSRKGEDPNAIYYYNDPERMLKLDTYCVDDVAATREVAYALPWLSDEEQDMWVLDQQINEYGFHFDQKLAIAAHKIANAAGPRIDAAITRLTNGQVTTINQVARLKQWLSQYAQIDTLDKHDIDELLEMELPKPARDALLLRAQGAQAAVKKVDALLQRRCKDGRLRHAFVYHAAGTGRWSSRGAQVHNLKRPNTEDLEHAIEIIGRGDLDHALANYETPLSVIGDLIRAMICAAPGHVLIGGDFSGIEARVTAWLADEHSKLDVFRAYDASTGPDPYIIAAGNIFRVDAQSLADAVKREEPMAREQRQAGKAAELAFGFGGGIGAYRRFAPDTPLSDEEIEKVKNTWRATHPNIVKFWRKLDIAAWRAVRMKGVVQTCHQRVQFESDDQPFLWMTLPSGRRIAYPHARLMKIWMPKNSKKILEASWGEESLIFKDNSAGQWRDVRVWFGTLIENLVQGVARDLLAEAMKRVDAAGFNIVSHVHDEIVIEVPKRDAKRVMPEFARLMMQVPDWAEGLPIIAKPWTGHRYLK
jgi:DNA polymerase bacteriophage-type